VAANGTLIRDRGVEAVEPDAGAAVYRIGFTDDVRDCAIAITVVDSTVLALPSSLQDGTAAGAFIAPPVSIPNADSAIMVRTRDEAGALAQRPFEVTVLC
jgi:hypothetical protein